MEAGNEGAARLVDQLGHHVERLLPKRFRERIAKRFRQATALYVDPALGGFDEFVAALGASGAGHALLGEPASKPVVLVADEDLGRVRRLTTRWPVGVPVEVYSPSGLPGFAFGDMPYMPPSFARRVLANARSEGAFHAAEPQDGFFARLYRALYLTPRDFDASPDAVFADAVPGQAIGPTIEALGLVGGALSSLVEVDDFMARHGWRPPLDMLERIGCWNPWIADKLRAEGNWLGAERPGLTVFYIRQAAIEQGKAAAILGVLGEVGFSMLPVPELDAEQLQAVADEVRGGNWGKGPFPSSGGVPALVVAAFDPAPIVPDAAMLEQFPLLDNARIQLAKRAVREAVQAGLPRNARYNAMHSTDNAVQAWRAVREHWPDHVETLRRAAGG